MDLSGTIKRNFTKISPEYDKFVREKDSCRRCSLYEDYEHVGQSEGNAVDPIFMIIGEALGADEVREGRPFIGKAGQRLRQELRKHPKVFNRSTTLISNVLCCRPHNNVFPNDRNGPYYVASSEDNLSNDAQRKVKARELVNHCFSTWTKREIEIVRPKVIITLGNKSLDYVRGDSGITANRGAWKFLKYARAWSIATYHPSYVLRCQNDKNKDYVVSQFEQDIAEIAQTWSDIVNNDPRMQMTEEEYQREMAFGAAVGLGLEKSQPIVMDIDDD